MNNKIINIFTNETDISLETRAELTKKLVDRGYTVTEESMEDADLIICIGGDGSFLETIHSCKFPKSPVIGINTGHLGFFQEISPDCLDQFITDYEDGQYSIQDLSTVKATVTTLDGRENKHLGLNEIIIKGRQSYAVHFGIAIDGKPLERFSGSIVDPRLDLLQVTPIAPMNTTAYRSFTSSILLPAEVSLEIYPVYDDNRIFILNDGKETGYSNVKDVKVEVSDTMVHLMRFKNYDFWNKVKTKFL